MAFVASLVSGLGTVGAIMAAMAGVAVVESAVPLHPRGAWTRAQLRPNLALTFITFATNLVLNALLLAMVVALATHDFGILRWLRVPPLAAGVIAVVALDFAFYTAHRSWHALPSLWRFHAVHHSDPA